MPTEVSCRSWYCLERGDADVCCCISGGAVGTLVVLAQEILTGLDVGGGFTALSRIQTGFNADLRRALLQ